MRKLPRLEQSFNGFNPNADRTSAVAFVDSYIKRFPDRRNYIEIHKGEALEIAQKLIIQNPYLSKKKPKVKTKQIKTKPKPTDWVPYSHYIPDTPHPMKNYRRQATNIARSMREAIDSQHQ